MRYYKVLFCDGSFSVLASSRPLTVEDYAKKLGVQPWIVTAVEPLRQPSALEEFKERGEM